MFFVLAFSACSAGKTDRTGVGESQTEDVDRAESTDVSGSESGAVSAEESAGQSAAVTDSTDSGAAGMGQDGSIPAAYKDILDCVYEVITKDEVSDDVIGMVGPGIPEARIGTSPAASRVGYVLYDVDGNGVWELIIADTDSDPGSEIWDNRILSMYTLHDDNAVTVIDGWMRNRYYILNDGTIYNEGSGGAAYTTFATYHIADDGLSLVPADYYFSDYLDDAAYAAGTVSWFHNTAGEHDVNKSEIMEFENDEIPWEMQEKFESQIMQLDLTFFSDYKSADAN